MLGWRTGRGSRKSGEGFARGFLSGVLACLVLYALVLHPASLGAEQRITGARSKADEAREAGAAALARGLLVDNAHRQGPDGAVAMQIRADAAGPESGADACPAPIPTMPSRGQVPALLNREKVRVAVELGVDNGGFSKFILMHCELCERYYMVDLWGRRDDQATYADGSNLGSVEKSELRMKEALDNVAAFGQVPVVLRNSTVEAASLIADGSVDFIYVDARHDYMSVMEDLERWWPKLRTGGILSGHDYMTANEVKFWKGPCPNFHEYSSNSDYSLQPDGSRDDRAVRGAVDEFAAKMRRQVQVTYNDGTFAHFWFSWFMRK